MRALCCGDRDWDCREVVRAVLSDLRLEVPDGEPIVIIHGRARGADSQAALVARELGYTIDKPPTSDDPDDPEYLGGYPADWNAHNVDECDECSILHTLSEYGASKEPLGTEIWTLGGAAARSIQLQWSPLGMPLRLRSGESDCGSPSNAQSPANKKLWLSETKAPQSHDRREVRQTDATATDIPPRGHQASAQVRLLAVPVRVRPYRDCAGHQSPQRQHYLVWLCPNSGEQSGGQTRHLAAIPDRSSLSGHPVRAIRRGCGCIDLSALCVLRDHQRKHDDPSEISQSQGQDVQIQRDRPPRQLAGLHDDERCALLQRMQLRQGQSLTERFLNLAPPSRAFPGRVAYCPLAGPIRNAQMLREGKPDLVVAFHDDLTKSKGTANMINQAAATNIPVRRYTTGYLRFKRPRLQSVPSKEYVF